MSTRVWTKFVLLPLMIVAVALSGCGNDSKPKETGGGSTSGSGGVAGSSPVATKPAAPAVDVRKSSPVASLDPETITAESEKDGGRKYAGKVIEVTGTISLVSGSTFKDGEEYHVGLRFKKELTKGLACFLQDPSEWSKLGGDQEVTLKGIYNPSMSSGSNFGGQAVTDCVVVKAGPATQIVIDAEKLAQEFAANRETTNDKYRYKTMVVTAELLQPATGTSDKLVLKGTKDVKLACGSFGDQFKKFTGKPGDKVKVLGRYLGSGPGQIDFDSAFILK